MPEIIVTADTQSDGGQPPVMFRERVSARDFESQHFARQLVERIGWAVGDAATVECAADVDPVDREAEHPTDLGSISSLPVSPALGRAW